MWRRWYYRRPSQSNNSNSLLIFFPLKCLADLNCTMFMHTFFLASSKAPLKSRAFRQGFLFFFWFLATTTLTPFYSEKKVLPPLPWQWALTRMTAALYRDLYFVIVYHLFSYFKCISVHNMCNIVTHLMSCLSVCLHSNFLLCIAGMKCNLVFNGWRICSIKIEVIS